MLYVGSPNEYGRKIGLAYSTDGISWKKHNDPSTTSTFYADSDPVLVAGPGNWEGSGVENGNIIVEGNILSLKQNYPNPFNPITNIEFQIPNSEFTTLKVYNILGEEMATLVSAKLNPGNHTYTFNGKNLASGVYYYQLVAGDFKDVRKMILLR